jgi:integrase
MAMGTRKQREKQEGLWIAHTELASAPGHPFYQRLNELLETEGFDEFVENRCAKFYAAKYGRPSLTPGIAGVVLKPGQRFGFHNLRHSLATFLVNKEKDTKTVQGLLRHANVSTTLGLYAQSVNSSMVEAQESMLKAILRNGSNAVN